MCEENDYAKKIQISGIENDFLKVRRRALQLKRILRNMTEEKRRLTLHQNEKCQYCGIKRIPLYKSNVVCSVCLGTRGNPNFLPHVLILPEKKSLYYSSKKYGR
jgi:hypothetical protein